jgi:hypothetical protein
VEPASARAVAPSLPRTEYLAQPVVVPELWGDDVALEGELEGSGFIEAGLLCRWSYDEAYALLVGPDAVLLCRYDRADRAVLAARRSPRRGWTRLRLGASGDRVTAVVRHGAEVLELRGRDPDPLAAGAVGIVANPLSSERGGRAAFRRFRARASVPEGPAPVRFAYRFAGAVVPSGATYRARVTARTALPGRIGFEVARPSDPSAAIVVEARPPEGRLGAVHAWLESLEPDTEYRWTPVAEQGGRVVRGPAARLRTPPRAGSPVRFAFGSCTSGRVRSYPSFARAAALDPAFFLHAGDWGYANLTGYGHRADHFQARWTRLLRIPEVESLVARAPLLFWQDDHDYQADNGWSATCRRYAVEAFDELHANPTDDYFEVRWGDVHVWCLDCRLFASDPRAPDGPGKTRLGAAQRRWLEGGMAASGAPVRVVASAMAFRDKTPDDPGWHNAYAHEREELLGFLAGLDATVVILSGDSHGQRLIHHHEFGELYEITSSGTDFPAGLSFGQGRNDPEHTLVYSGRPGFALLELDEAGPARRVTVRCVATDDGSVLFAKSLPVA